MMSYESPCASQQSYQPRDCGADGYDAVLPIYAAPLILVDAYWLLPDNVNEDRE